MNRIGFLFLLLAFASICVCSRYPSYWILMEANEDVQAMDWDQDVCVSFDFRGRFGRFGLIVGTRQDLQKVTQLSITKPGSARLIAHYHDAKYPLWVLESETESVHNEVKSLIHKDWIKYEHKVTNKYSLVIMGYKNVSVDLVAHLPVTIISVSSSRQVPLRPLNVATEIVEPNPLIVELIEKISQEELKSNVEKLSNIFTRLATSSGAVEAQHLLEDKLKALGLDVVSFPFKDKYSADVIGELKGVEAPDEIIIISAHYDSRSTSLSNTELRAPGADDNGSGSSNTLEIARVFSQSTIKFKHTLRFCFWSGEEQGLIGSRAYAKQMKANGENIIAVLNGDMLGWKLPNKAMTIGMSDRYISKPLNDLVNSITRTYVPDIGIGWTSACCSDHQSFYEYGFPSVGFFENTGSATSYPHYHRSTDLPEYLNFEQITLISKAIAASAATLAVPLQK